MTVLLLLYCLHHIVSFVLFVVRQFLEGMGKTLFFRSGNTPLVLSHAQVEERKRGWCM